MIWSWVGMKNSRTLVFRNVHRAYFDVISKVKLR